MPRLPGKPHIPDTQALQTAFEQSVSGWIPPRVQGDMFREYVEQVSLAEDVLRRGKQAIPENWVPAVVLGYAAAYLQSYGRSEEGRQMMAAVAHLPSEAHRIEGFAPRRRRMRNSKATATFQLPDIEELHQRFIRQQGDRIPLAERPKAFGEMLGDLCLAMDVISRGDEALPKGDQSAAVTLGHAAALLQQYDFSAEAEKMRQCVNNLPGRIQVGFRVKSRICDESEMECDGAEMKRTGKSPASKPESRGR